MCKLLWKFYRPDIGVGWGGGAAERKYSVQWIFFNAIQQEQYELEM